MYPFFQNKSFVLGPSTYKTLGHRSEVRQNRIGYDFLKGRFCIYLIELRNWRRFRRSRLKTTGL